MCGIVGYSGKKNSTPILLEGLRRLEYRGYDSAGIAVVTREGIKSVKVKGKVGRLEERLLESPVIGNCGIAHTRWATHGKPSVRNAHPFVCDGFAIVHNGIIENWKELKSDLLKAGYRFSSDTDSEVALVCFCDLFRKTGSITTSAVRLSKILKGSYAFLIIDERNQSTMIGIKNGNPLIVGKSDENIIAASDVVALLSLTNRAFFIEDGEFCIAKNGKIAFYDFNGSEISKTATEINWNQEQAKKGGYKHYLIKEIMEQPEALGNTLAGRVDSLFSDELEENILPKGRIIVAACGSSYNAALCFKYFINRLCGISVSVEYASEFRYQPYDLDSDSLVVVLSQSGETSDTKEALLIAKNTGAKTVAADKVIYMNIGPEISVASTKAYTTEVALLYLLALRIASESGMDYELIDLWKQKLKAIPAIQQSYLEKANKIEELAKKYYKKKNFLYIGRGIGYPVAVEGALKLKELSYLHAECYPAGEMKHGPISLIDADFPTIAVMPDNLLKDKLLSNISEIKSRMGKVIVVSNSPVSGCDFIKMPKIDSWLSPLVYIVPLQLFSYYVATLLGNDVDQPRNLAKSVTVE